MPTLFYVFRFSEQKGLDFIRLMTIVHFPGIVDLVIFNEETKEQRYYLSSVNLTIMVITTSTLYKWYKQSV